MNKPIIYISLLLLIANFGFAQQNLRGNENYAINDEGDTLWGFIEEIGETRITIAALIDNDYVVQRLSTKSIKEYHINDTIFRRISVNLSKSKSADSSNIKNYTATIFLKLVYDGSVALYERNLMRLKMMDPSINSNAKGFLKKIPEVQYYLKRENENASLISKSNFYEIARITFSDKQRIKDKLNQGYYTFENLNELLLDYNYLVENNLE